MATQPLGSTIGETLPIATGVWGATSCSSIDLRSNIPLGIRNKGVKLSSNGLSSSGRCSDRESLGTSDPQEPLKNL